jgi:hypothetical protein
MYKYSPSTRGFYIPEIHGDGIPADAVDVSAEQHDALMTAQSEGNRIEPDAAGNPVAVAPAASLTLADVKAAKLSDLAAACAQRMATIKAGYPADEISTWDKQESEAREYKRTGGTAATPLLSALSSARGVALSDLVDRVIAKADQFAAVSGAIIGKRQRYEDEVAAAADAAGVAAIDWVD